ncbi:hypothetical protein LUZ63_008197 [Rhynchospora breviuscula]|uniref:Phytocyanin domain-containing protein n=1 Tax=Rhynchospora breviuscula TaxID=2022672 RepID=A0A9Q0CT51_9POAL|nr:hypothetical protein LUZ63_008197 [Rhynchospora breviuscula]
MAGRMNLVVLFVVIVCCGGVRAVVFEVGGSEGWVVPSEGDMYRHWISDKIFQVGDIIRFRYKNDSVFIVSQEDYESCITSSPVLTYRSGDSSYRFQWSGTFYIISGKSGHCVLGQKIAINVTPSPSNAHSDRNIHVRRSVTRSRSSSSSSSAFHHSHADPVPELSLFTKKRTIFRS